jgi:UDP-N-acetyl-2-amino-2-deoxyglucuronate dehydrogenase
MRNFALIGAAGYIAPRHLQAIKETGNNLVAALDIHDNVGILDSYFPNCDFFTEFERFDRHLDKLKRIGIKIDYVSICSPNYLHDSHIRFALRHGANAVCEKPLVLNPWNVNALREIEQETGNKILTILQLRLHPAVIALYERVKNNPDKSFDVDLTYITSRGNWYHYSWKGDITKSGGVATNIGIHFFDMLIWVFGDVKKNIVHLHTPQSVAGFLEFERARVRWFLSIDSSFLPQEAKQKNQTTYRSIIIEGDEIEFSGGFNDLHTQTYEHFLNGKGFGLEDAYPSIQLVYNMRQAVPEEGRSLSHPLLKGFNTTNL